MKILLSELENRENKSEKINFSHIYKEFNNDVPVVAELFIEILSNMVKITGQINAQVNLICDLCLKEFTKNLNIKVEEYFIRDNLNINNNSEFEIKENNFVEDLNGSDEIDITDFVYQSVILNIPNKLVCDINCNGNENLNKYIKKEISDPRLEIFKTIKTEKE